MSTSGETADLMVREGIQITESALKLAGLGAKNLAALLIALANDNQKVAGKTTLKRLIQDREELTIFSINEQDLAAFKKESTQYGVLYYPIINKAERLAQWKSWQRPRTHGRSTASWNAWVLPSPFVRRTRPQKKSRPVFHPAKDPGNTGQIREQLPRL